MSPTSSAAISKTRRNDNQESAVRYQSFPEFLFLIPGGAIAQLGERLNGIQEVGGSTPPGSTKTLIRRPSPRFAVSQILAINRHNRA
jgi:hypothetical protein